MATDYIVDEVRHIREEQAARCDFDIRRILSAAKKRQPRSGFKIVSFATSKGHLTKASTRPSLGRERKDR